MNFLLETIRLGLTNLRLQLLRSILTTMGIIFGVAAVITMVGIGEGATREALAQIERLGAKNIIVRSQKPPEDPNQQSSGRSGWVSRYGLTYADVEIVQETFPESSIIVPLKEVGSQILRGSVRKVSQAFGTTPEFTDVAKLGVARGRYLTQADMGSAAMVCVIGSEVAKSFFDLEDPLGDTIRVDDKALTVVGILNPVGLSGGAGGALVGRDLNLDLHLPITTAKAAFGDVVVRRESGSFNANEVQIAELYVEAPTREAVLPVARKLNRLVEVRHPGQNDLSMIVPYELLENARKRAITGQWISAAIAAISLLVGGIGIMNIMLATVTERTREIGIRRALGATQRHIVAQFLVETGVLSTAGGIVGVILGLTLAISLDRVVPMLPSLPVLGSMVPPDVTLPTAISGWSVIVSFVVASSTGLIFGLYPARKAARQDPIVALRHD